MRQLLYVSNTSRDFPDAALDAILSASRRNNAACDVTGMLLYMDGGFLQVLEGPDAAVDQTYRRIRTDARHWNAHTLLDRDAPRAFTSWRMGFQRINPQQAKGDDAMFLISRDAINGQLKAGAALELAVLLQTFYRIQLGDPAPPARQGAIAGMGEGS